ncbi:MAG: hypothetical protein ACP5SG_01860 [Dissulfurimicrobium sp.]|uniref:hypothetical protein n=1 Tax=Dissulfurimicrobium sp. TaxID=2022436 RepID=UPI003D11C8ED
MLNTFKIYQELMARMDQAAAETLTNILGQIYEDLKNTVTQQDFAQLKAVVVELAEAQKRTEQRVAELAEAQKRTEERLDRLEQTVAELAEAQKRTEQRVAELAEAQKRTEERLDRLEQTVAELAEAQKETERRLQDLIGEVKDIKVQLGGLSMAVGYGIEDKLMPFMHRFVPRVYGAMPKIVERKNVRYSKDSFDEVNIYMEAIKDGQQVLIVGECKAHPGKKDLKRFDAMLSRLSDHFKMPVQGFIVGYAFSPEIEDLLAQRYSHIKAFKTYEIERIAAEEVV